MAEVGKKTEKNKVKLKATPELKTPGDLAPLPKGSREKNTEERLRELEAELAQNKASTNLGVTPGLSPISSTESAQGKSKSRFGSVFTKSTAGSDLFESHGQSKKMLLFWGVLILSVILSKLPGADIFFLPLNQFTVMVHEMSHALTAIVTGGAVHGMTIVADGQGHGGLTQSMGGIEFLVIQAGYMGTAIFGCLLVYLSQYPRLSKGILIGIGSIIALATMFFMAPGLLSMQFVQVLFSMLWGLAMAAVLIYSGLKLKDANANLLLLFLAIYTAMDSLRSIVVVLNASMFGANAWSDATVMQNLYFLPAMFWSLMWATLSVIMLGTTIWFTYGFGNARRGKTP